MYRDRPRLQIATPTLAKFIEYVALLATLGYLIYLITQWSHLPDTIPTHYTIGNVPDRYGSKIHVLIPVLIGLVCYIGCGFIQRRPHVMNLPVEITKENAPYYYYEGVLMMSLIRSGLLFFFLIVEADQLYTLLYGKAFLGIYATVIGLILIFLPLPIGIYRLVRVSRRLKDATKNS